jgi:hypothetical protein
VEQRNGARRAHRAQIVLGDLLEQDHGPPMREQTFVPHRNATLVLRCQALLTRTDFLDRRLTSEFARSTGDGQ